MGWAGKAYYRSKSLILGKLLPKMARNLSIWPLFLSILLEIAPKYWIFPRFLSMLRLSKYLNFAHFSLDFSQFFSILRQFLAFSTRNPSKSRFSGFMRKMCKFLVVSSLNPIQNGIFTNKMEISHFAENRLFLPIFGRNWAFFCQI